jgi:hypothetical protein
MDHNWASPLKQKKTKTKDPRDDFKKDKCVMKSSGVRKLTGISDADEIQFRWVERLIDQIVSERCYPPQLRSNEFYSLLATYFGKDEIIPILDQCRNDFVRAFPLAHLKKEDPLDWLGAILRADPAVTKELPTNYLL